MAPILWQNGALARLKKGEKIDKLLYGGYSTISLGYAGLCECTRYMKGVSHTDPEGKEFALKVMQHMNDACAKWRAGEQHRLQSVRPPRWSPPPINLPMLTGNVLASSRV